MDKEDKRVSIFELQMWSGDITYICFNDGFMYLAVVIDWYTKAILSYKISNSMDETLAKYPKPKIFNSNQESQHTSNDHTQLLKKYK